MLRPALRRPAPPNPSLCPARCAALALLVAGQAAALGAPGRAGAAPELDAGGRAERPAAPPGRADGAALPDGLPDTLRAALAPPKLRLTGAWGGYALRARASAVAIGGGRAVAAGNAGVRIFDLRTGRQLRLLPDTQEGVEVVALSPDGRLVATGGRDGTIALWEAETGRSRAFLRRAGTEISALAFSRESRALAAGSSDGLVRVWDLAKSRVALVLRGHKDLVRALGFLPGGQALASAGDDGTLRLWDLLGSRSQRVLGSPGGPEIAALAVSPGGKRVLAAEVGGGVRLWNLEDGRALRFFPQVGGAIALAFAADGARAFAVGTTRREAYAAGGPSGPFSPESEVWTFELAGVELVIRRHRRDEGLVAAAFSADGALLLTSEGGGLRLVEVGRDRELLATTGHRGAIRGIAISPNGTKAITAAADHTARLWDLSTGKELSVFGGYGEQVQGAAFSPDGKLALIADLAGVQRLWDLATGEPLRNLGVHRGLEYVAFAGDGNVTLSASSDRIALWDAATGRELGSLWFNKLVDRVSFSTDGRLALVSGSTDGPQLFDVASGKLLQTFTRPGRVAHAVALSPDAKVAAVATSSAEPGAAADLIELWDVGGGLFPRLLTASGGAEALAWSPDGRLLLAAGREGDVTLYAPALRREVSHFELGPNDERPTALAFGPDGLSLMVGTSLGGLLHFLVSEDPLR